MEPTCALIPSSSLEAAVQSETRDPAPTDIPKPAFWTAVQPRIVVVLDPVIPALPFSRAGQPMIVEPAEAVIPVDPLLAAVDLITMEFGLTKIPRPPLPSACTSTTREWSAWRWRPAPLQPETVPFFTVKFFRSPEVVMPSPVPLESENPIRSTVTLSASTVIPFPLVLMFSAR